MGAGIQTVEEVVTDPHGRLITDGTWWPFAPTAFALRLLTEPSPWPHVHFQDQSGCLQFLLRVSSVASSSCLVLVRSLPGEAIGLEALSPLSKGSTAAAATAGGTLSSVRGRGRLQALQDPHARRHPSPAERGVPGGHPALPTAMDHASRVLLDHVEALWPCSRHMQAPAVISTSSTSTSAACTRAGCRLTV